MTCLKGNGNCFQLIGGKNNLATDCENMTAVRKRGTSVRSWKQTGRTTVTWQLIISLACNDWAEFLIDWAARWLKDYVVHTHYYRLNGSPNAGDFCEGWLCCDGAVWCAPVALIEIVMQKQSLFRSFVQEIVHSRQQCLYTSSSMIPDSLQVSQVILLLQSCLHFCFVLYISLGGTVV